MFQHFKKQFVKDYLLALKDKHSIRVKNFTKQFIKEYFTSITGDTFLLEAQKA